MISLARKLALTLGILAGAALSTAATAMAQNINAIQFGNTNVTLSSTFLGALSTLKVTAGTIGPTQLTGARVNFPVVGGAIDVDTAGGQIFHTGGLTLSAGKVLVTAQSFIIDTTGEKPVITALVAVNGKLAGRIPLFDLTLPDNIKLPIATNNGILQVGRIQVALDTVGADALNAAFGVKAFSDSIGVGTANTAALVIGEVK